MHSNLSFSSNLDRKRKLNSDPSKKKRIRNFKKSKFFYYVIVQTHSNNISIAIKCVMLLMKVQ